MNFELTEDQRTIQEADRVFAAEKMAPHSAQWDAEKHFPVDVLRKAAVLGSGRSMWPRRRPALTTLLADLKASPSSGRSKTVHPLVDLLAELGDLALGDPAHPHRMHQVLHLARRNASHPGLVDHPGAAHLSDGDRQIRAD